MDTDAPGRGARSAANRTRWTGERGTMTRLQTDRLELRPWEDDDARELAELLRDGGDEDGLGLPSGIRLEGDDGVDLDTLCGPESYAVIDLRTSELLGSAALAEKAGDGAGREADGAAGRSFELSFWIGRPFRGYGYATEAAHALVRHAASDLGATRVWASCPAQGNQAQAVLETCGLTPATGDDVHVFELVVRRTLYVDADACPVTAETLACARQMGIPAVIAGNTTQNLERHIRRDDPRDAEHARRGFWVGVLGVSVGADSADFAIVERLLPGDVVVTQDIGLASMVLGRGAAAISVRGHVFRRETIDAELLVRHEEKRVRRAGGRTGGPRAFTASDRRRFTANLERMLSGRA